MLRLFIYKLFNKPYFILKSADNNVNTVLYSLTAGLCNFKVICLNEDSDFELIAYNFANKAELTITARFKNKWIDNFSLIPLSFWQGIYGKDYLSRRVYKF